MTKALDARGAAHIVGKSWPETTPPPRSDAPQPEPSLVAVRARAQGTTMPPPAA
jgi:hypothetical protein